MNYALYYIGFIFFISGVSLLSSTTDSNGIIFGGILLFISAGSFILGGKIDE